MSSVYRMYSTCTMYTYSSSTVIYQSFFVGVSKAEGNQIDVIRLLLIDGSSFDGLSRI